jgi:hypothetical protein
MRHTSEILKELGFNEDAPESTKRALLKHLQHAVEAEKSTGSSTKPEPKILRNNSAPEQLSFDFTDQTIPSEGSSEPVPPKRISHR